ncbi:hypothetical protein T07_12128 [Trichinella nelsoni]|uniref:Uncharacterized protein n=1 Tax=Trichinella nelsoni TaxID=6336 RepID=A0A0V0RGA6_9BILA|nr:hypothetical protein T07_12128 [Trichinella nelsoni]
MSYCFKRDVTKLQTITIKIDRMRRKENPLGWALPQQSIKGQYCCNFSLQSDSQVRPAIFDITGDPEKTEAADLAQAH